MVKAFLEGLKVIASDVFIDVSVFIYIALIFGVFLFSLKRGKKYYNYAVAFLTLVSSVFLITALSISGLVIVAVEVNISLILGFILDLPTESKKEKLSVNDYVFKLEEKLKNGEEEYFTESVIPSPRIRVIKEVNVETAKSIIEKLNAFSLSLPDAVRVSEAENIINRLESGEEIEKREINEKLSPLIKILSKYGT